MARTLNQLINPVTQQLKPASEDFRTPAGKQQQSDSHQAAQATTEQKEAINQIFELFRFNYHNQFLKAFPDHDTLIMAKRLWSRLLADYSPAVTLRAAEKTVKENAYLPNVYEVLSRCDSANPLGLPSAHAAYMEACRAPSPKQEYDWSHPAVYFAGRATDWFFLANEAEQTVFPVFKRNYELLLQRLQDGDDLSIEIPKAVPETIEQPLSKAEQLNRLEQLKRLL